MTGPKSYIHIALSLSRGALWKGYGDLSYRLSATLSDHTPNEFLHRQSDTLTYKLCAYRYAE
jgi:hypothetical protein